MTSKQTDSEQSDTPRFSFTQPCCGECWEQRYPGSRPVVVRDADTERCCYCGGLTTNGIYVRVAPDTVPFPSLTKD